MRTRVDLLKCKHCKRLTPHKSAKAGKKLFKLCLICDTVRSVGKTEDKEPMINPRGDL